MKQTPLLPEDPYQKAMARFWIRFGENKAIVLQSIRFGVLLTEGKEQQEATLIALQNLKYLEEELRGKKFFGGEKIGLVDLALGWLAYYLEIYEERLGVWQYVEENRVPPPLRQNPTLNQIRQHEDEVAKAPKALSYIHAAVSDSVFTRIMACESAHEAWMKLKTEFQGSDKTRQMQVFNLRKEFELLRMKDTDKVKEYVDR
ncbi:hypothetical protein GH714_026492 [Hevea brasiliensis]|uniref:GST C-terminal domain-containing protein n=1 Tax=Hevea brasiliensis TaxID=3981 RepID=A0A6A6N2D6_HEVBR|nr:hypothetical protein GH714_026492 [Hevea brasiliensis]